MTERNTIQPYTTEKILKFKRAIEKQHEKGNPPYYEIFVDGLKVIKRTNDFSEFDGYEEFVDDDTNEVLILLYSEHATSPRNTKHRFIVKEKKQEPEKPQIVQQVQTMNGLDFESRMKELLEKERLQNRVNQLEEKLAERDKKIADAEDYMGKMQAGIERVKLELESSKSVWGERLLDLAKNPPDWLKMVFLNKGNTQPISGTESTEGDVSFKKKSGPTDSEQRYLEVLRQMEDELDEESLAMIMLINDKLIQEQNLIPDVADLVGVKLTEA